MKKKLLAMLLAAAMAFSLLPGMAFAEDGDSELLKVTLSEQYLFAGRNGEWYTEEAYRAAPVVIDLDGDGRLEVLNAAYSLVVMDAATGAEKWRVNAGRDRSTDYSNFDRVNPGQVFCDFKVLDIDNDGENEIVIGYGNGSVSVLSCDGYFKDGWPVQVAQYDDKKGGSIRSLVVDDLDLDDQMEIIVGLGIEEPESVWVYRCDGTLLEGWPQLDASQNGTRNPDTKEYRSITAYSAGIYGNGITTGDLNGDGYPEIIVPTDTPYINAYYYDGSLVKASDIYSDEDGSRMWGKIALYEDYDEEIAHKNEGWGWDWELDNRAQTYRANLAFSSTVYTDLDGDGTSEIVVSALMADRTTYTTQGNNVATLSGPSYMTVFILNQDRSRYVNEELGFDWTLAPNELTSEIGNHLKKYDANSLCGEVFPVPVCADLDGEDGYQEILFNSFDGKLHCFSLDGTEHDSWPFVLPKSTDTVYEYPTQPACVDLDGDGTLEVIFASWTDCDDGDEIDGPYGQQGAGTGVNGALYVLSSKGELLASMDLHNGYRNYGDRNDPAAGYTNGVMAAPAVADIDGDGKYEVMLNTTYYALCAYEISLGSSAVDFSGSFHDVPEDVWYANPVLWAVTQGITNGYPGDIFGPADTCTHAQIITFLWRAAGKPASSSLDKIPVEVDIDPRQWYAVAVYWAAGQDMIDENFDPNALCSRADAVTYIWKAFNQPGTAERLFSDVSKEDSYETWYAVCWAASHGVVTGYTDSIFGPEDTCSRAQIVTFLYRAYVEPYVPPEANS